MSSHRATNRVVGSLRRLVLSLVLPLALFGPDDIHAAGAPANGKSSAPEHIKLVAPPYFTSAPFYLAADLGFFAAEGLDVEFVSIAFSKGSLPALAQEQVDVVGTTLNAGMVNLIGRGAKVRIVAARTYEATDGCPGAAVLVRKGLLGEGRLASGASMRGLRFSIDRATVTAFYVSMLLDRLGLEFDDFELSDFAGEARGEALRRGLIDLTVAYEPHVTNALDLGGAEVWMAGSHIAPGFQSTFVLFGERLLERQREVGQRFLRAYLRAVERYTDEAKSEALVDFLAQRTHLDPDVIRRMCWPPTVRDGRVDPTSLERYQAWAITQGLIDAPVDASKMIDTGFLPVAATANEPRDEREGAPRK